MTRGENPYTPPSNESASRGAKQSNKNLVGLIVSAVMVLAAPIVGAVVSVVLVSRAFQVTERVAPSEKARVLAQGISAAMNGAAGGLIVSFVALVSAIVFAVRLARARRGG